MSSLSFEGHTESWALAEPFVISRGAKVAAEVVVVTACDGQGRTGRGECVPYGRYGETAAGVLELIGSLAGDIRRSSLASKLAPGAARNAVDCALWDLEARRAGVSVAALMGVSPVGPVTTAFTLSLARPDEMAKAAERARNMPLLKLKLAGDGNDATRMQAVRAARPDARLIADANEAWLPEDVAGLLDLAAGLGFETVEQPLAQGADQMLGKIARPLPVCADESFHVTDDLARLAGLYDAINIKLDKAGGLSEATRALNAARQNGFKVMVGSMVSTSLAMAPAFLLAQDADWVDLDSPLLLREDRAGGFTISGGVMRPAAAGFWGDGLNASD